MSSGDLNSQKQQSSGLTAANLCCLIGTGLVIYGAFLLQPAIGFVCSGALCVAYGVHQQRAGGKK